ncbi:hypothetical protein FOL47_008368 [Perkinsus chesapeaki]|uniref:Uncharacterized protein n=1 Tax=Perkinsus chesapeaki TaxID=330153 RepID=A0A7J6LEH9_PERCH|nr:hypothetical protein FOL47_008368 [Perkinsus chesapeaki]
MYTPPSQKRVVQLVSRDRFLSLLADDKACLGDSSVSTPLLSRIEGVEMVFVLPARSEDKGLHQARGKVAAGRPQHHWPVIVSRLTKAGKGSQRRVHRMLELVQASVMDSVSLSLPDGYGKVVLCDDDDAEGDDEHYPVIDVIWDTRGLPWRVHSDTASLFPKDRESLWRDLECIARRRAERELLRREICKSNEDRILESLRPGVACTHGSILRFFPLRDHRTGRALRGSVGSQKAAALWKY